jgi:hypothetical protein
MERETLTFRDAIISIVKIEMAALQRKSYAKETAHLPAEAKDAASGIPGMNAEFDDMDISMDDDMPDWEPDHSADPEEGEAPVSSAPKAGGKGKAK